MTEFTDADRADLRRLIDEIASEKVTTELCGGCAFCGDDGWENHKPDCAVLIARRLKSKLEGGDDYDTAGRDGRSG